MTGQKHIHADVFRSKAVRPNLIQDFLPARPGAGIDQGQLGSAVD